MRRDADNRGDHALEQLITTPARRHHAHRDSYRCNTSPDIQVPKWFHKSTKRGCPQPAGHRTPLVLQTVYVTEGEDGRRVCDTCRMRETHGAESGEHDCEVIASLRACLQSSLSLTNVGSNSWARASPRYRGELPDAIERQVLAHDRRAVLLRTVPHTTVSSAAGPRGSGQGVGRTRCRVLDCLQLDIARPVDGPPWVDHAASGSVSFGSLALEAHSGPARSPDIDRTGARGGPHQACQGWRGIHRCRRHSASLSGEHSLFDNGRLGVDDRVLL